MLRTYLLGCLVSLEDGSNHQRLAAVFGDGLGAGIERLLVYVVVVQIRIVIVDCQV